MVCGTKRDAVPAQHQGVVSRPRVPRYKRRASLGVTVTG